MKIQAAGLSAAVLIMTLPAQSFMFPLPPVPPGGMKFPLPPVPPGGMKTMVTSRGRPLYAGPEKAPNNFMDLASRFYNELVPWGDAKKGLQTLDAKRKAMVIKYMEKTGCSKEEAEAEVAEYLKDKNGYVARKRAEEEEEAAAKKK